MPLQALLCQGLPPPTAWSYVPKPSAVVGFSAARFPARGEPGNPPRNGWAEAAEERLRSVRAQELRLQRKAMMWKLAPGPSRSSQGKNQEVGPRKANVSRQNPEIGQRGSMGELNCNFPLLGFPFFVSEGLAVDVWVQTVQLRRLPLSNYNTSYVSVCLRGHINVTRKGNGRLNLAIKRANIIVMGLWGVWS